MQRLLLFGLNHTTAPLALRERLAMPLERQRQAMGQLRSRFPDCEFLVLNTCNRVEVYAARPTHGHPRMNELIEAVAEVSGVDAAVLERHGYQKTQKDVVEHLFRVAAGLDSMVVGETEVLGQLRDAYERASDALAVGETLNPLVQRALRAGRSAAALAANPPSVAWRAVDHAARLAEGLGDKAVLTIGAGTVAASVVQHLAAHQPRRLIIANRDRSRAVALAESTQADVIDFGDLSTGLASADVVLTSTASPTPIVTRDAYLAAGRRQRTVVVDLGVPRDVEPAVRELDHVLLADLDDLNPASSTPSHAVSSAPAEEVVRRHVEEYVAWQCAREYGPAIDALYQRYHQLAEQELQRAIGGLGLTEARDVERLRDFSRRMVNKLLHDPVQALRQVDALQSPAHDYRAVMEKLFKLNLDRTDRP